MVSYLIAFLLLLVFFLGFLLDKKHIWPAARKWLLLITGTLLILLALAAFTMWRRG